MLTQIETKALPVHAVHEGEALAEALNARSPEAWTHVYEAHHDHIYRYALARTSDSTDAADLAAATFLEALRGAHKYSYRGRPVLAWLYTIARNVVADHHKAARRAGGGGKGSQSGMRRLFSRSREGGERVVDDEALSAGRTDEPDPASGIERIDVRDAINRLPTDQREVIVLRYYVGLPLVEVAQIVSKPDRKIYSLQAKAIEALRRNLEGNR